MCSFQLQTLISTKNSHISAKLEQCCKIKTLGKKGEKTPDTSLLHSTHISQRSSLKRKKAQPLMTAIELVSTILIARHDRPFTQENISRFSSGQLQMHYIYNRRCRDSSCPDKPFIIRLNMSFVSVTLTRKE